MRLSVGGSLGTTVEGIVVICKEREYICPHGGTVVLVRVCTGGTRTGAHKQY